MKSAGPRADFLESSRVGAGPRDPACLSQWAPHEMTGSLTTDTTLPQDLLEEQSIRIQLLYWVGLALWIVTLTMDLYMSPQGDRGPYRVAIELGAAALAAVVATWARYSRARPRTRAGVGVAFMVPHAFALALLNSWTVQPTTMRPLSGVTVLILLVGMLAPARPGWVLAVGLVASFMDPVGVWIAHLRGLPTPSPIDTVLMFYPNYVCALLAVVPSRILYRLGRKIGEARALGAYELIERLGEGGMGEVWRARHRLLARTAAIKLIRPEMLDGPNLEKTAVTMGRFEREARATAALTSPHTIRLFDYGLAADGTFYYAMELLDGCDLESLVKRFGPLPASRVLYLIRQICQSLAEAHTMGLIHRDIKPANVYACRLGLEFDFVKVLDFGLVKPEDRNTASTLVTLESVAMGTPAYMAPETILGEEVDRRVDVYAVGCLAYFLLTGSAPFTAESTMQLLMRHVQEEPIPPSCRTEQHIPRALDDLVIACLHKDRRLRPDGGQQLLELARACTTHDDWNQSTARTWWMQHLPQLATPGSTPTRDRQEHGVPLLVR